MPNSGSTPFGLISRSLLCKQGEGGFRWRSVQESEGAEFQSSKGIKAES